jgi:hypothetical protein
MFIVVLLSTAAVRQSMDGITQAGIANQQVQSIAAAEAGIQFEEKALSTSQTAFVCPSTTASTLATGVSFGLIYLIQTGGTVPSRTAMTSVALSATLSTSAPITSLAVGALQVAIAAGSNITVVAGGNLQTFNTSAAAAVGATTIQIMSVTPSFAFPVLSTVTLGTACTSSAAVTLSTTATSYILLKSAGNGLTSNFGAQTVQALLQVTAPGSAQMPYAVHGDAGLALSSAKVTAGGSIYAGTGSSGNSPCGNNQPATVAGNVVSATTAGWAISNSCTVTGNVWGAGPISLSTSSPSIAGTIKTPSTITVNNQPTTPYGNGDAGANIIVPTNVIVPKGGKCPTNIFRACTSNDATVTKPASDPFPSLTAANFPTPTWTSQSPTCANAQTALYYAATAGSGNQLVVLPTGCQLSVNGVSQNITNNLAVILPEGLSAINGFTLTSSGGPWNVYLVVPAGSTANLTMDGPNFSSSLHVLMDTPGNVSLTNFTATGLTGQVYAAGTVSSTGGFNLAYAQVPVSGLSGGAGTATQVWEYHST